jgi:hypothetical protein
MSSSTGFNPPGQFHLWWRPGQPHEIHLVTDDPTFVDANHSRPGLWITWSCNPASANYHPAYFNRAARALAAKELPSPPLVPEHDRKLNRRERLIALFKRLGPQLGETIA